jgi:hypothetical protein
VGGGEGAVQSSPMHKRPDIVMKISGSVSQRTTAPARVAASSISRVSTSQMWSSEVVAVANGGEDHEERSAHWAVPLLGPVHVTRLMGSEVQATARRCWEEARSWAPLVRFVMSRLARG